jgi:predicted ATPase
VLTRIEIDGFKSFADFSLDVPPFLAIVGPNASGKSNLFDAIQFLSSLATRPVSKACGAGRGEITEVFRRDSVIPIGQHEDRWVSDLTRIARGVVGIEVVEDPSRGPSFQRWHTDTVEVLRKMRYIQ